MDPRATVVEYDPAWPQLFDEISAHLTPAVDGLDVRIEHIGSTAVPGLAAKPIVDVDIVVREAADIAPLVERLAVIGYVHQGDLGVEGREAFACPTDGPYHHLYAVIEGEPAHRDHIDLRDRLRAHPEDARRYEDRKREVAPLLLVDREAYVEAKSDVIQDILRRARIRD
jgi:GrpB-like predicted nucleotidyltransferase (UPF0157 family)